MKMIFAIVRKEDEGFVIERLNKEKISVTKLSSTGGFLRKGNATLMIGTEDEKVDTVLNIIKEECSRRKEVMITPACILQVPKDRCLDMQRLLLPLT